MDGRGREAALERVVDSIKNAKNGAAIIKTAAPLS
jgi:hypothetical protein